MHLTRFGGSAVRDIGNAFCTRLHGLGGFVQLCIGLDLYRHQNLGDIVLNGVQQLTKQLECLAFVFLLGLFLRVTTQVGTLAQLNQRTQMVTPVAVDALEQDHTLELGEITQTNLLDF